MDKPHIYSSQQWADEQLKEEQQGYKLGFNPSQTSLATAGKTSAFREPWYICELGKYPYPASQWS